VILTDDAIPHYARLAAAVQRHGARIFGQLSHSGRVTRRMRDGMRGVVYAPSPLPENRFHTVPREMPTEMVAEIIEAAAQGARRYAEAGYDGVELMASHGLLFAQFLNPAATGATTSMAARPKTGCGRCARRCSACAARSAKASWWGCASRPTKTTSAGWTGAA
jgi:hypothetical protein